MEPGRKVFVALAALCLVLGACGDDDPVEEQTVADVPSSPDVDEPGDVNPAESDTTATDTGPEAPDADEDTSSPPDPKAERTAEGEHTYVYWGDQHVHTRFSPDAWFALNLADELKYPRDVYNACEFARFCSSLDFMVSSEHAEYQTKNNWDNIRDQVRQCAVDAAATGDEFVAYQGFEWTQSPDLPGESAPQRYGHKIVHFRGLDNTDVTPRPIVSANVSGNEPSCEGDPLTDCELSGDSTAVASELGLMMAAKDPDNPDLYPAGEFAKLTQVEACTEPPTADSTCLDVAFTPDALFTKLDAWRRDGSGDPIEGREFVVGSHGTAWGLGGYANYMTEYVAADIWPEYERYVEIFSKHGSSEEYRIKPPDYVLYDEAGNASEQPCVPSEDVALCRCNQRVGSYVPCCRRCVELLEEHYCKSATGPLCTKAKEAAEGSEGSKACEIMTKTGTEADLDWLDCDQCPDCSYLPAAGYTPTGSVQAALTHRFGEGTTGAAYLELGFVGATDTHHARPGSVQEVKEFAEIPDSDLGGAVSAANGGSISQTYSFWYAGGLAAVHIPADSQDDLRTAVFDAVRRRETYATSGPRIKLWVYLVAPDGEKPMGSVMPSYTTAPTFRMRAVGDYVDTATCDEAAIEQATGDEAFVHETCRDTCYAPDADGPRRRILRFEVVRIQRRKSGEAIAPLIEDPWRVLSCDGDDAETGVADCTATFTDETWPALDHDALYYVRAIQEPVPTVNAGTLRCERDDEGTCTKSDPCPYGEEDGCLALANDRAWSSPIYLYH